MLKVFRRRKESEKFDDALDRILDTMNEYEVGSPEYAKAVVFLERVGEVRKESEPDKISRDTYIIVAGGILQVILIVFAEQNHVVVSKALSFILKPKNRDISI